MVGHGTTPATSPARRALGLSRSISQSGEPWTAAAETAHNAALAELDRLERIIAWYWRTHGPYPIAIDEGGDG